MIIDRGEAEVDNHIPNGDIFSIALSGNVIIILLYHTFGSFYI